MAYEDQRGHAGQPRRTRARGCAGAAGRGRMRAVIVDCAIYRDGRRTEGPADFSDALDEARATGDAFLWIGLYEPTEKEFDHVSERVRAASAGGGGRAQRPPAPEAGGVRRLAVPGPQAGGVRAEVATPSPPAS